MPVTKEIWTAEIKENFVADNSFIFRAKNLSQYVYNNVLHLSEAGRRPKVVKISEVKVPLEISQREDNDIKIPLDGYASLPDLVTKIEELELSYPKMASVIQGHKDALQEITGIDAAYQFAPKEDTTKSPVLTATGKPNEKGLNRLTFADVSRLSTAFDRAGIPQNGRVLILTSDHNGDLSIENITMYNSLLGKPLFGFDVFVYEAMPHYNVGSLKKMAIGATVTDDFQKASICFSSSEAFYGLGDVLMFIKENDPQYLGTMVNFMQKAYFGTYGQKGIGAIISRKNS